MSDGINRVQIMGNLGADPELRFTQGGAAVLNLRIAVTTSYQPKDGERTEHTEWFSVVVWGKRAEALAPMLQKGSKVYAEGESRTSSYEKDGQKHYKTEVNATDVKPLANLKPRADGGAPAQAQYAGPPAQYGAPQQQPARAPDPRRAPAAAPARRMPWVAEPQGDPLPY